MRKSLIFVIIIVIYSFGIDVSADNSRSEVRIKDIVFYEIELPETIDDPDVIQSEQLYPQSCGTEGDTYDIKIHKYYHEEYVAELSPESSKTVKITYDYQGSIGTEVNEYTQREFVYDRKIVYVKFASKNCQEEYEKIRDKETGTVSCIALGEFTCSDVRYYQRGSLSLWILKLGETK